MSWVTDRTGSAVSQRTSGLFWRGGGGGGLKRLEIEPVGCGIPCSWWPPRRVERRGLLSYDCPGLAPGRRVMLMSLFWYIGIVNDYRPSVVPESSRRPGRGAYGFGKSARWVALRPSSTGVLPEYPAADHIEVPALLTPQFVVSLVKRGLPLPPPLQPTWAVDPRTPSCPSVMMLDHAGDGVGPVDREKLLPAAPQSGHHRRGDGVESHGAERRTGPPQPRSPISSIRPSPAPRPVTEVHLMSISGRTVASPPRQAVLRSCVRSCLNLAFQQAIRRPLGIRS